MNNIELGKKIKEARLIKKMTQNEVVGTFITRNMLSQIENGTAAPSIKTLKYLCQVLDLPADQLINEEASYEDHLIQQLVYVKNLLREERHQEIIDLLHSYPAELEDECWAILAQAYLGLAREAKDSEDYSKIIDLTKKAIEYANKGLYANPSRKTEGLLLLTEIAKKASQYFSDLAIE